MRDPAPTPSTQPASPPLAAISSPAPSQLSSHAEPFCPSSFSRSKLQRWIGSLLDSDSEEPAGRKSDRSSYRDIAAKGLAAQPYTSCQEKATRHEISPPPLPRRIRLRSEIHRVLVAAPNDDGWREVRSKRSRRRQQIQQLQRKYRRDPKRHLDRMAGRYFNCLSRGHKKEHCREPTRCLRCMKPGHRSSECRQPSTMVRHHCKEQPQVRANTNTYMVRPHQAAGGQATGSQHAGQATAEP